MIRKLTATILLAFQCATLVAVPAWQSPYVPYPSDSVPSAVMPTLPTGADTTAFPYDPLDTPPVFAGATNQYYIDTIDGNDGTAGNSGRGSEANPRQTLPGLSGSVLTLNAGDQYFITDNSLVLTEGNDYTVVVNGTSSERCWIIGVDTDADHGTMPRFRMDQLLLSGSHLRLHALTFARQGGCRIRFGNGSSTRFQYGVMTECLVDGLGYNSANAAVGGSGFGPDNCNQFIVVDNCVIRNHGQWDQADDNGVDQHAVQFVLWNRHIWVSRCAIYHNEGDSIQTNTTTNNNNTIYGQRPHYMYYVLNELWENYENAIDNKNCFHVISAQNYLHDFYNEYKPANGTALLLSNDGVGWLSGYEWAIANRIEDSSVGVKMAPTTALTVDDPELENPNQTAGQVSFAIGNTISGVMNGINLDGRGDNPNGTMDRTWYEGEYVVANSISSAGYGIRQIRGNTQPDEPATIRIAGNIIRNNGTDPELKLLDGDGQINEASYNVFYRVGGSADISGAVLDVNTGNILDSDPLYLDPGNHDLRIDTGSPALDVSGYTVEEEVFGIFLDLYGLDIAEDIRGLARPDDTTWDAGAFEGANGSLESTSYGITWTLPDELPDWAGNVATPPTAPSGLTATATGPYAISLSWTDNSDDETAFRIYRATTEEGTYGFIGSVSEDVTTFIDDSHVMPNTTYWYKVLAANSGGDSALTSAASDMTEPGVRPKAISSREADLIYR